MLGKVTTQRTQQFLNVAHAQLLENLRPIDFAETCRFLAIQFQEFGKAIVQKPREWYIAKNLNFDIGNFLQYGTCSENDLRRITKIAYVKILLKQCWQKGFYWMSIRSGQMMKKI